MKKRCEHKEPHGHPPCARGPAPHCSHHRPWRRTRPHPGHFAALMHARSSHLRCVPMPATQHLILLLCAMMPSLPWVQCCCCKCTATLCRAQCAKNPLPTGRTLRRARHNSLLPPGHALQAIQYATRHVKCLQHLLLQLLRRFTLLQILRLLLPACLLHMPRCSHLPDAPRAHALVRSGARERGGWLHVGVSM